MKYLLVELLSLELKHFYRSGQGEKWCKLIFHSGRFQVNSWLDIGKFKLRYFQNYHHMISSLHSVFDEKVKNLPPEEMLKL